MHQEKDMNDTSHATVESILYVFYVCILCNKCHNLLRITHSHLLLAMYAV